MFKSTNYKERLSDNPNGVAWSKDETKFGQRLLEKMGWKRGKGLGAKEDGRTEHVKVALKSDKKGVGCDQKHTDRWLDRLDEYEAILSQLNNSDVKSSSVNSQPQEEKSSKQKDEFESLNSKSEGIRNRMHYSKFTKGKDLSLKSEMDLDCIFGRKRAKVEEDTTTVEPEEGSPASEKLFGVVTTTSSTNLQDYFTSKLAALRRAKSDPQLCQVEKETDKVMQEEAADVASTPAFPDETDVPIEMLSKKIKKKKRKQREVDPETENGIDGTIKSSPIAEVFKNDGLDTITATASNNLPEDNYVSKIEATKRSKIDKQLSEMQKEGISQQELAEVESDDTNTRERKLPLEKPSKKKAKKKQNKEKEIELRAENDSQKFNPIDENQTAKNKDKKAINRSNYLKIQSIELPKTVSQELSEPLTIAATTDDGESTAEKPAKQKKKRNRRERTEEPLVVAAITIDNCSSSENQCGAGSKKRKKSERLIDSNDCASSEKKKRKEH